MEANSAWRYGYAGLLLIAVLVLSGCGEGRLETLGPDDRILAFGDSLTEGYGVAPGQSYPVQLAQITGLEVINAGVSGEETSEGLARLEQVLQREAPQLVLLLEGGNDILRNRNAAQIRENLAQMIEQIRASGAQVVLIGVPEKNLFSSVAPVYRELAEQYDLVFIDTLIADLLRTARYKSDQVHFNALGYRALAEGIAERLEAEGAF
ncbi:arylesterase [Marinobacterium litorale]|uniref:arylesterase n=1 Tax=Marinobacterium litorale TaxID=404770 RepID=UPI000488338D|nr:arylesterase [Marinobacterium litorale]